MDPYILQLADIARTYNALGHGDKTKYLAREAERLGCVPSTLLGDFKKKLGWASGRKARADKGSTRIDKGLLEFTGTLQKEGLRKNGKATMPLTTALSIAAANGHNVNATPDHVRRVLRNRGMDVKTQTRSTPHVWMRPEHPNHVHQVDPSMCVVYYLKGGGQAIMREQEFNKNKPHNLERVKDRTWRYVLWDAASSAIKVRYFQSRGETQHNLLEFVLWAWSTGNQHAPYGVPRMLYMDPGSANTAHSVRALCEALGVEMRNHLPGVARASGGVENAQNIVETQFECRLRAEPIDNVDELNDRVETWTTAWNANAISGQDTTLERKGRNWGARRDLWMLITAEEMRFLPSIEVCRALATGKPQERKVMSGLEITFKHPLAKTVRRYSVAGCDGVNVGDVVNVRPLVYGDCEVRIHLPRYDGADLAYTLQPRAELDQFGNYLDSPIWGDEYKSLPKTANERMGSQLDQLAFPGKTADEIKKARTKNATPMLKADGTTINAHSYLADVKVTTALPRRGETINVPDHVSVAPAVPLTHFAACKAIVGLLQRPLTVEENDQVRAWYPDGVLEDSVPMVAQCVGNGTTPFNVGRALKVAS